MNPIDAALARAWEAHQQGDVPKAEQAYWRVIGQAPASAQAWCYLGLASYDLGRFVEAEQAYRRALQLQPQFPVALNNLGNALKMQGRFDEAVACFEQAIRLDGQYVSAHFNLGTTCLLAGDEQRGWREFVWREKSPSFAAPKVSAPRWQGEPLAGKSILLWAEQGLGDTLHFVRYAQIVRQRGGRVIAAVQKPLLALLARAVGIDELVATAELSESARAADFHAPLMSLPALLGTVEAATTAGPPYLRPDDVLSAKWRERLTGAVGSAVKPHAQYKVGIAWSGNPQHADDRRRSIPLEMFAPLAAVPGVRLVNLQKGPGSEQVALSGGRVPMLHPPGDFDAAGAFTDTAAIIGQLDLVIAADTAVAHLAGALHVPTWLALSHLPDWRWRNSGETTPWYPAMRLWRQSRPGQWEDVFDRMTAALAQRARKQEAGAKGGRTNDEGQTIAAWRRSRRLATNGNAALKQTRHGPMLYNRHDAYIGRSLDEYGEFSPGEVDVFRQVLKPGDVVIEAGANIGAHTVPLAQFVGRSGAVHAFEPQRAIFQMLCANLALSALPNVFARQAAVGAQAGSIVVPQFDYDRPNNFGGLALGGLSQGAAPPGGETVPVLTIDSLELSSLALIKIDVEGMEADVLEGARATIARHKPILYVENDREEKSAALIALIASLGYRLYWHAPPMFAERNFYQNPVNAFGNTVSRNMLCLHASLPAQIRGLAEVGSGGVGE